MNFGQSCWDVVSLASSVSDLSWITGPLSRLIVCAPVKQVIPPTIPAGTQASKKEEPKMPVSVKKREGDEQNSTKAQARIPPNIPAQVDTSTRQRNNDRGTTSDGRKANDPTGSTKKQVMATQPRGSARINDQFCSGGGKTNCSMVPKVQKGTMIRSHPPRKATSDQPRGLIRSPISDRFSRTILLGPLYRNITHRHLLI